MADAVNNGSRLCEQCGQNFVIVRPGGQPKRFCSDACRQTAKDRRRGKKPLNRQSGPCSAQGCSNRAKVRGLCHKHYLRLRAGKPLTVNCEYCGKATDRPRFCSVRCSQLQRDRSNGVREFIPTTIVCAECGRPTITTGLRQSYCSTECRKRVSNRRRNHIRRLRTTVEALELFDPIEVLARDGWRCHICGEPTPKRLRGTHHDRAPELDHIVPLALGGPHSRLNTACACRKCNIAKGSNAIGQLRLVA